MTSTYLQPLPYDDGSFLQNSDQVMVPADVWTQFDTVGGALFVYVGDRMYGRLRPATPDDGLAADSCRLPTWMLKQLDGENEWVSLNSVPHLDNVTHMVLRARKEADVLGMSDPVAILSDELSGASDAPGWAVLTTGQELPLACGTFDVIEMRGATGPVVGGIILDTDVSLEFVPALDAARTPTPIPTISPPFSVSSGSPTEEELPFGLPSPMQAKKGFVPFSGKGHVLGKK
jgi:hypothetical protein